MLYWKGHYYLLGHRRNEAGHTEDVWLLQFPTDVFQEDTDISDERIRDANPTHIRLTDCDDELVEYIVTRLRNISAQLANNGPNVAL